MRNKIILGLSGGVDSAVCLYLLKKQGYDVDCLFMRNWDSATNSDILGNPNDFKDICPQEKDYIDCQNICNHLNSKLYRKDFVKEYWDYVFSYFLDEYKKNRTPNPDIMCNKYIKFDHFLKEAKALGANKIAMGHYANVIYKDGLYHLTRAKDINKDQTYFLCMLSQEQISNAIFPLGNLLKREVRKIAKENNISVFDKKDSTGICFIGERKFSLFLKNYIYSKPGIIRCVDGNILGNHTGLINYTIGQRKGLNIGGNNLYENNSWFVVGKDLKNNEIIVDQKDSIYLLSNKCIVESFNIISIKPISGKEYTCKFRYRQSDVICSIEYLDNNNICVFYKDTKAVTPGQAFVLYDGLICLGGGIIKEVFYNNDIRAIY